MPPPDSVQPVPFPGGIADLEGRHACLRDRGGHLVAIALERGTVLWRSSEALRPLIIARGEVIALRTGTPAECVALGLAGTDAGQRQWTSDPLPLPAWAELSSIDPAQFWIAAELHGATIRLRWRARARYRGGAAPGQPVLEQAARDAEASVVVDRASGKVTILTTSAGPAPPAVPEPGPAAANVLEQRIIGAHCYQLVLETSAQDVRTLLRAVDAGSDALLWETTIDEGPPRRPKALRL